MPPSKSSKRNRKRNKKYIIKKDQPNYSYGMDPAQNFNLAKATSPIACIFHFLFKILAGLSYLFMGLFTDSSVLQYVTVLLLNCLDFWVVKNVTGRKLIGLRWWTYADLNFENMFNKESEGEINKLDNAQIKLKQLELPENIEVIGETSQGPDEIEIFEDN